MPIRNDGSGRGARMNYSPYFSWDEASFIPLPAAPPTAPPAPRATPRPITIPDFSRYFSFDIPTAPLIRGYDTTVNVYPQRMTSTIRRLSEIRGGLFLKIEDAMVVNPSLSGPLTADCGTETYTFLCSVLGGGVLYLRNSAIQFGLRPDLPSRVVVLKNAGKMFRHIVAEPNELQ
jgi:hypothetical protein